MDDDGWEPARLIPVSGINGADEQERRGVSGLLAVLASVREFGRAVLGPLGAPAGTISTYIEVPFTLGDRQVRPDGLIRVRAIHLSRLHWCDALPRLAGWCPVPCVR